MPDFSPKAFTAALYEKMCHLAPAVQNLALYEFCYCLQNLTPTNGWAGVTPLPPAEIEHMVNTRAFYDSIQIKPTVNGRIVLDEQIVQLTQMLFVGMVRGDYTLGVGAGAFLLRCTRLFLPAPHNLLHG